MKRTIKAISSIALVYLIVGCATIITEKADLNSKPDGIRIYPPKVYLFIDKEATSSMMIYAPDYQRAYDVKPRTILAKQDFKVEIDEGQLKSLTANQDTTSILSFIQSAAQLAAKAAGMGVSASLPIKATFGLDSGMYVLDDDGIFRRIQIRK